MGGSLAGEEDLIGSCNRVSHDVMHPEINSLFPDDYIFITHKLMKHKLTV